LRQICRGASEILTLTLIFVAAGGCPLKGILSSKQIKVVFVGDRISNRFIFVSSSHSKILLSLMGVGLEIGTELACLPLNLGN
jgi:hypothetical protein